MGRFLLKCAAVMFLVAVVISAVRDGSKSQATDYPQTDTATAPVPATQTEAQAAPASSTPVSSTAAAQPLRVIEASYLISQYDDNEVRADSLFKGKVVSVSGTAVSITKTILGTPHVRLEEEFGGIDASFERGQEDDLVGLSKGMKVVISGEVIGLTLGTVVMGHCRLVPASETH